ncbi:MAG: hypothetical protein IJJ75_07565 [Firmicutes bacterium]|nr:hypothetical protein [Bacillota bacterium]
MSGIKERIHRSGRIYDMLYGPKAVRRIWLAGLFSRRNRRRNEERLAQVPLKGNFLYGQGAGAPSDGLRFGISTMRRSGCEVMACCNVLAAKGISYDLAEIISEFEKKGASAGGFFGASPAAIAQILNEKGVKAVLHRIRPDDASPGPGADGGSHLGDEALNASGSLKMIKSPGISVLTFWWGRDSLVIHTVMIETDEEGMVRAWNFESGRPFTIFPSLTAMTDGRGLIPVALITTE